MITGGLWAVALVLGMLTAALWMGVLWTARGLRELTEAIKQARTTRTEQHEELISALALGHATNRDIANYLARIPSGFTDVANAVKFSAPEKLTRAAHEAKADAQTARRQTARFLEAIDVATKVRVTPDELLEPTALRGYKRGSHEHAEAVKGALKAAFDSESAP